MLLPLVFLVYNHPDVLNALKSGDMDEIYQLVDDNLVYMLILTFVLMFVQNVFTLIPLVIVLSINITFFGFVNGLIWSWFLSLIGATIVFFCVRYFFKDLINNKINDRFKMKENQKDFMYVFIARIFPFFPTGIVNMVAGISSIKFSHFIIATSIGNFLYFLVLSLIPLGLLSVEIDNFLAILLVVIIIAPILIYKKYKRKKQKLSELDNNHYNIVKLRE